MPDIAADFSAACGQNWPNFWEIVVLMGGQKYTKFHWRRMVCENGSQNTARVFLRMELLWKPKFLKNCNRCHKMVLSHHRGDAKLPLDQF